MDKEQQVENWVKGFIKSWKSYTEYCKTKFIDVIEDIDSCDKVLNELTSDFPRYFVNSFLYGKVSEKMLRRAEEFDYNLFKVKLIGARLNKEEKKDAEIVFRNVESLLAFCAKCKLQQEGKWEEEVCF